ncbi:unnamed protein product [Nezara viridula]|uniref:Uncharacterized protein n=1 Tax=Nezara viridula TaxID=85310 RepID=A0A9P0E8A3_NEZVI|nr:unnamed protein product [Nezara viridula]
MGQEGHLLIGAFTLIPLRGLHRLRDTAVGFGENQVVCWKGYLATGRGIIEEVGLDERRAVGKDLAQWDGREEGNLPSLPQLSACCLVSSIRGQDLTPPPAEDPSTVTAPTTDGSSPESHIYHIQTTPQQTTINDASPAIVSSMTSQATVLENEPVNAVNPPVTTLTPSASSTPPNEKSTASLIKTSIGTASVNNPATSDEPSAETNAYSTIPSVISTSTSTKQPDTAKPNDDILEPVVKPLNDTLFAGSHWISQQDSAPAQLSSGCRRAFQSSSLPWIGPQPTRLSALVPNWRGWHATEHTLT